ncbi:MAG: hypothetical protein ACRDJE_17530 [Dehalococcoidia bacterium]
MQRQRMTVELDALDVSALKELAAHDGRTTEDMVAIAVRNYVARRTMNDDEWKRRWDRAVAAIRSGVPRDVTPEEIESDVRAARAEYRAQRHARNG